VHGFDGFAGLRAPGDIRLVGHHDEPKIGRLQAAQGLTHAGKDFQLARAGRGIRLAIPHRGAIDDAVAVQENGPVF